MDGTFCEPPTDATVRARIPCDECVDQSLAGQDAIQVEETRTGYHSGEGVTRNASVMQGQDHLQYGPPLTQRLARTVRSRYDVRGPVPLVRPRRAGLGLPPSQLDDQLAGLRQRDHLLSTTDLTITDRCRIARLMAGLGPTARDHAAADLIELLANATLGLAERRTAAATLAQISPVYHDVAAAHLHTLATLPWPSTQRPLATADLAELSPVYRQQATELLRAQLHLPESRPAQRVRVAAELVGISLAHTPEAAQTLLSMAHDGSLATAVRHNAARHLIEKRSPGWRKAAQTMEQILVHPHTPNYLRHQAAQTLIECGHAHRQTAVAALTSLMNNHAAHPHDRLEAATTMCRETTNYDSATDVIRRLAQQPALAPHIRRRAALCLGAQDPEFVAEATAVLRDIHAHTGTPAEVRTQAAADLAKISPTLLSEAAALLKTDLQQGQPALRLAAARCLSQLGPAYRAEAVHHARRLRDEADGDPLAAWIGRASRRIDRLSDLDP